MTDGTLLLVLGIGAAILLCVTLLFYSLHARSIERVAASVTRVAWPDDGSQLSRDLDRVELAKIQREVAWLLDVRSCDVSARPESAGQGGHRCGAVVVVRGPCGELCRGMVIEVEDAVRGRLSRGATFAIVVRQRVEMGRPSRRMA
jgi:hypothetical protein